MDDVPERPEVVVAVEEQEESDGVVLEQEKIVVVALRTQLETQLQWRYDHQIARKMMMMMTVTAAMDVENLSPRSQCS